MGRSKKPNGFFQRFQQFFSTPSTGKEKKLPAFPTPSTLPTGTQGV